MNTDSHLYRFKLVYISAAVIIASAISGELEGLKDKSSDDLHKLTWVFWTVAVANIVVSAGTVIAANFAKPPISKQEANAGVDDSTTTATTVLSVSTNPRPATTVATPLETQKTT